MTATLTRRQPGQLHPPVHVPQVLCTCPPGYTHPDREQCWRHGKQRHLTAAIQALREHGPQAAWDVCHDAAHRPWWRP